MMIYVFIVSEHADRIDQYKQEKSRETEMMLQKARALKVSIAYHCFPVSVLCAYTHCWRLYLVGII